MEKGIGGREKGDWGRTRQLWKNGKMEAAIVEWKQLWKNQTLRKNRGQYEDTKGGCREVLGRQGGQAGKQLGRLGYIQDF